MAKKREKAEVLTQEQIDELNREDLKRAIAYFLENRFYAFRSPKVGLEQDAHDVYLDRERLFLPPNPKQAELIQGWNIPEKKVFTFTGGNRLGKTVIGVVLALSTLFGEWPDGKKIEFPHRKARRVRYVGQGWETHIKAVVEPALSYWWPKVRPLETKKNNQGIKSVWRDEVTGSQLEIMSTSQQSDTFEGWDGDLVVYDEPPPRDIRVACARGLIDRNGRELIVATLLKEAWVYREVIKARLDDGKPDPSVYNVTGEIYDNVGYGITREGIDQFSKSLKPEEREARLKGKPSYLSSLVYDKFSRDHHVKDRFAVPLDALVDISIDFHPSKPWAVVFLATFRNNFKYVCDEIWDRGNPKYIAEQIVRKVRTGQYRVNRVVIDPLSKGDQNNDDTVYDRMAATLSAYGFSLETASKDKDSGIALTNSLLWTENDMPGLFFFSDCVKTIQQVEDLMYDPDSLKPTALKIEDDFTECLYRLILLDTQWFPENALNVSDQKSMML